MQPVSLRARIPAPVGVLQGPSSMAFLPFFSKKKVDIEHSVRTNADGSSTVTTSFQVPSESRPVRSDVVELVDSALGRLGSDVLHAMDPRRIIPFELGGPPVWSVGMVEVGGPTPYTLLVTYGFSHVLSPEPMREGLNHEFSLAVPKGIPLAPWADAFLRHQTRYILTQGADIRPNDCIPLRGVPMTRVPFQPEHHAMMPNSSLVGVLATADPVLPRLSTPHGDIEVRRLVGIDALELDRAETWSPAAFIDELKKVNPLLLSDIGRGSFMEDAAFKAAVDARADAEGSTVDAALFDLSWQPAGASVTVHLPKGRAARRLSAALRGRVGFNRRLVAFSMKAPPIVFEPEQAPGLQVTQKALMVGGGLAGAHVAAIVQALARDAASVELR